jgi:hypothetical protein
MKWMGIYLTGYLILLVGIIAGLWQLGVLEQIGGMWTGIGLVIAVGFGIMIAVSGSGEKKTVEIDRV